MAGSSTRVFDFAANLDRVISNFAYSFSQIVFQFESLDSLFLKRFAPSIFTRGTTFSGCAMSLDAVENSHRSSRYVAWMDAGHAAPPRRCYVDDVSTNGAKLRAFGDPVPNEFTLHFNRRGDAKVRCRVISRAEANCDIEFVASLAIYNGCGAAPAVAEA
jgi:hypothetical protein